jgi:y4mF family transcriptional regulator
MATASSTVEIGAQVRDARRARGLTQAVLAERAGVSRKFVIDLERGQRTRAELDRVLAVVRALDLEIALVDRSRPTFDAALDELLGRS